MKQKLPPNSRPKEEAINTGRQFKNILRYAEIAITSLAHFFLKQKKKKNAFQYIDTRNKHFKDGKFRVAMVGSEN